MTGWTDYSSHSKSSAVVFCIGKHQMLSDSGSSDIGYTSSPEGSCHSVYSWNPPDSFIKFIIINTSNEWSS